MAAPESDGGFWGAVVVVLVASIGAISRWISGKASKEELVSAVNMLRDQHATMLERVDEHYEEARESREKLYNKFDDINRALGATMVSLSRLQGQLDRNDQKG
jgi:hypothetical protein